MAGHERLRRGHSGHRLFILGFAWFYMREQVCWAAILVLFMLIFIEFLKLKKWLKDTVSIQVIIHKNEKDEDRKG